MVEVEIRSPRFSDESRAVEWRGLARVRADGAGIQVGGDESVVHMAPVVSLSLGKSVHPRDNPEEWARNLPQAYRSGDLVAVLIRDDAAPAVQDQPDVVEPEIPDPPVGGRI